jgi:hypothetical protein
MPNQRKFLFNFLALLKTIFNENNELTKILLLNTAQLIKYCFCLDSWTSWGKFFLTKKNFCRAVKFIYSEKATKFCEISTADLFYIVPVKSTVDTYFTKFCGLLRIYELKPSYQVNIWYIWYIKILYTNKTRNLLK